MIKRVSTSVLNILSAHFRITGLTKMPLSKHEVSLISTQKAMFGTHILISNKNYDQSDHIQAILSNEDQSKTQIDFQQTIAEYPFTYISVSFIRNYNNLQLPQAKRKQLAAFKALTAIQADLSLAKSFLLPESSVDDKQMQGQQIFDQYFAPSLQMYVEAINKGDGKLVERLSLMNILINTSTKTLQANDIRQLDQRMIVKQDPTGAIAAYYTRFLIKNQLEYTHLLDLLLRKLKQPDNPNRLYIAQAILSTPKFIESYSKNLIDAALLTFQQNLSRIHNYKILYTLRQCYLARTPEVKRYCRSVRDHLTKKYVHQGNVDIHVPVILKTIKTCGRFGEECDQLVQFVSSKMQRFKIIFNNKQLAKGIIFNLMFSKTNPKNISQQSYTYLKDFLINGAKEIAQAGEIEQIELIRYCKLYVQFSDKLTESQQSSIRQIFVNTIIPHFKESSEILFFSLLAILRHKFPKPNSPEEQTSRQQQIAKIKKYIVQYLRTCSKMVGNQFVIDKHVSSAIQIYYQITRNEEIQFRKGQLPSLLKYDFSIPRSIQVQCISLFFNYLNSCKEPKQLIRSVLERMHEQLSLFIRKKKIRSIYTIYCILDVFDKCEYNNKHLFGKIQTYITLYLHQNPNYFMLPKDVKFINQKIIKKGFGSSSLKQFINGVIRNPKDWPVLKAKLIKNELNFQQNSAQRYKNYIQRKNSQSNNRQ